MMETKDGAAWARAIATPDETKARGRKRLALLRSAERWATGVERLWFVHPSWTLETALANAADDASAEGLSDGTARVLRELWIYGPRFWAWWQGRNETKRSLSECATLAIGMPGPDVAALMKRYIGTCEWIDGLDPRPVLRLASGETVRADALWRFPGGAWANADGSSWYFARNAWQLNERGHPYSAEDVGDFEGIASVYPSAEAKPVQYIDIPSGVPEALCEGELVPPALRGPDGNVLPFRQLWRRPNGSGVALQTDEAPPAAFVEGMTCVWPPRHRKAPADAKADPTAAYLTPGDQIRTKNGWCTVTAVSHPAYPHVTCADGVWFREAILETRKAADVPRAAVNAHGVDVSRIAVGDYVAHRAFPKQWVRVDSTRPAGHEIVARGESMYTKNLVGHRPAPRIVLPDGRSVVPDRMYRDHGGLYANIDDDAWIKRTDDAEWSLHDPGDPWTDSENAKGEERTWPPLDVEPA